MNKKTLKINESIQRQLLNVEKEIIKLNIRKRYLLFRRDNPSISLTGVKIFFEVFDFIKLNNSQLVPASSLFKYENIQWGSSIKNAVIESLIYLNKIVCVDKDENHSEYEWHTEMDDKHLFFKVKNDFSNESNVLPDKLLKLF